MSIREARLWLSMALCSVVACSDALVSVGALNGSIDLTHCSGEEILCEDDPLKALNGVDVSRDAVGGCSRVDAEPWHVAWTRELIEVPCGALGRCSLRELAVGGDGTVWAAGLASRGMKAGIFLAHYSRDGATLAERVIDTRPPHAEASHLERHALTLAADSAGHAYVAVSWNEHTPASDQSVTTAWLGEFDAQARPVGEKAALRGVYPNTQLGLKAADSMFLVAAEPGPLPSGSETEARMLKFRPGLQVDWVQTYGAPGVAPGASLAFHDRMALVEASVEPIVTSFSDIGNVTAILAFPETIQPFGVDARGFVLALENRWPAAPIIRKLTPGGDSLFRIALTGIDDPETENEAPPATAIDSTGTPYFLRPMTPDASTIARLVTLDAEAYSCAVSSVLNDPQPLDLSHVRALLVAEQGEVYVQTSDTIARLIH